MNTIPHDWCVVWSARSNGLYIVREEQMLNVNEGAMLDGQPGFAVLRMHLTRDKAERYARAMQGLINLRARATA